MRKFAFLPLALGFLTLPAFGGPITADGSYYQFGFTGTVGSFAFACGNGCAGTTPPSDPQVDSPWTFSGSATLFVLDLFASGDSFTIYDNDVAIGNTSTSASGGACGGDIACAIADANYSRGTFLLGAGDHSITIQVLTAPVGPGAAVFSLTAADVPEPSTFGMLGAGLVALGFGLRRRRRRA